MPRRVNKESSDGLYQTLYRFYKGLLALATNADPSIRSKPISLEIKSDKMGAYWESIIADQAISQRCESSKSVKMFILRLVTAF